MLNTRRSIPLETIMGRPTVLELESLNDEEKALVMLFLLTLVREHCRVTRTESRLQHVTLIEEAHRVMAATPHAGNREVSADTRAVATELFSATLSEVRAYGEGLIIAEQIPGRLAEDALKKTSVKLVHRLPGESDRAAVGGTMNMGAEQEQYLSKLAPGTAALFVEGFERPTFITVPDYRGRHHLPERMPDERVEERLAPVREAHRGTLLPFDGCRSCLRQCRYRDRVTSVAYDLESARRFRQGLWSYESERRRSNAAAGLEGLVAACREAVAGVGLAGDEHAAYCYFTHLWAHPLPERAAERFRQAAAEAQHGRRE
jgi:hypothetical protein